MFFADRRVPSQAPSTACFRRLNARIVGFAMPHCCRLCFKSGHRAETCPSNAGKLVRELEAKLCAQQKAEKARPARQVHKTGAKRVEAKKAYTGRMPPDNRYAQWTKRENVKKERSFLTDPQRCFEDVAADGIRGKPDFC